MRAGRGGAARRAPGFNTVVCTAGSALTLCSSQAGHGRWRLGEAGGIPKHCLHCPGLPSSEAEMVSTVCGAPRPVRGAAAGPLCTPRCRTPARPRGPHGPGRHPEAGRNGTVLGGHAGHAEVTLVTPRSHRVTAGHTGAGGRPNRPPAPRPPPHRPAGCAPPPAAPPACGPP